MMDSVHVDCRSRTLHSSRASASGKAGLEHARLWRGLHVSLCLYIALKPRLFLFLFVPLVFVFWPDQAVAYIGPGAGFAFLGSTFVFLITILLAISTLCFWPIRVALKGLRGRKRRAKAKSKKVVVLGLDGLEPTLIDKYMSAGRLPNFTRLKQEGCYARLGTTLPALSPVAWSSFQTGVNPGAHNIFDFVSRDKRNYLPTLASTTTKEYERRIGIGKFSLRKKAVKFEITRKSKPFWKVLGEHGIFSNVLRVPISYPPEKCYGNVLSAMCTPDLRGTQGTFSFYTSETPNSSDKAVGGERHMLERFESGFRGSLIGPPKPEGKGNLTAAFIISREGEGSVRLRVGEQEFRLELNEFSPWVTVEFYVSRRKSVSGICRFCVRELEPRISLYVTPININPENPALPISEPLLFSKWLSKEQGLFGTLGLMEDTWGRNEHVLDDQRFLDQAYLNHAEREKMFLETLARTRDGFCGCVFDASDRIQHMFWRYLDEGHPAPLEDAKFKEAIPDMYSKMDDLLGKVREVLTPEDTLIVMSDHGFASFRRCVNLNTWLYKAGYLALKNGVTGADYLADVDWGRTKAFALGLSGIFLNQTGREADGTLAGEDLSRVKRELIKGLEGLRDPVNGAPAVSKVYDTALAYKGLYVEEAPDLIVGYNPGYRVSWDSVTGTIEQDVFSDNLKAWSGDHHIDPGLVPGIFLSNRALKADKPHIMDVAPSVVELFGIDAPAYMEGRAVL